LSRYSHSRSSRLALLPLAFSGMLLMAGCSPGGALSLLTGGGPNVAANVQAGKTNSQTVGQTNNVAPKAVVRPKARVDSIDQSSNTTTNNDLPVWVWIVAILLFIVGWVTDTPATMVKQMIKRKQD